MFLFATKTKIRSCSEKMTERKRLDANMPTERRFASQCLRLEAGHVRDHASMMNTTVHAMIVYMHRIALALRRDHSNMKVIDRLGLLRTEQKERRFPTARQDSLLRGGSFFARQRNLSADANSLQLVGGKSGSNHHAVD